jgi:hypothetical protein
MAVIIFAPWRMIPWRSTCVPIMKPGTSARNTRGTLKASQHHTKRAALSAESTNSTPPRWSGWFATTPTGLPSSSANPVMISRAKSGFTSKNVSASTSPAITSCMSKGTDSSTGMSAPLRSRAGGCEAYDGGASSQRVGR